METQLEQIREQQKQTWNKFSSGWKKWDDFTMNWLRPMGEEIISSLKLKDTDRVLDIAAGTGEPGLTIASIVKNGNVVITDLAADMLSVAREKAEKKGLKNYETITCDASELPFEDNTFDAISCRLGFMFFPDMLMAAKEMVRVLKPGGKLATSVWGVPEKNFWITATMGTINKNIHVPAPPTGSPGMFRCAAPGFLADLFNEAGLKNITEHEVASKMQAGDNNTYWNFMNDVAAPVVAAMSKADDELKEKIRKEVFEAVDQKYPDKKAAIDWGAVIVSGVKA